MASVTGVGGDPGVSAAACVSLNGHPALWLLLPECEKEDVRLHGSLPGRCQVDPAQLHYL